MTDDPLRPHIHSGQSIVRGTLGSTSPPEQGEQFDELVRLGGTMIEEITSSASPDTGPSEQEQDEWVVLLTGTAELEVEGESVTLGAGDWIVLPARTPHRV